MQMLKFYLFNFMKNEKNGRFLNQSVTFMLITPYNTNISTNASNKLY